ncbi:MAG TPA: D-2-hydroxyacid dehydrogenase [Vicinamibacterales bacterium]|nr:D-2-hydroxyacid dehydrogenase [Vicinamibacterales bacterium]
MRILIAIHSPFAMWRIPQGHVECLRRDFPHHEWRHARDEEEAQRLIPDVEVAFSSQVTRAQLASARRLQWIHSPTAGVGSMLFTEMKESGVVITNSRGMAADTMAEHVLAVTLALFRRIPEAVRSQTTRIWAQDAISALGSRTIAGATVLVIGLGAIGSAVASRMARLGAYVIGIRRRVSAPPADGVAEVVPPDRLADVLPAADVVVVAAPHTRETRGLIGPAELRAMKHDAILVNVSRGRLVDEDALATALVEQWIGGAALDVFVREPLPPDSPLWDLSGVLITPHTSGFRPDHWDAATRIFAENLRRFDSGQPLLNVVDKQAGY